MHVRACARHNRTRSRSASGWTRSRARTNSGSKMASSSSMPVPRLPHSLYPKPYSRPSAVTTIVCAFPHAASTTVSEGGRFCRECRRHPHRCHPHFPDLRVAPPFVEPRTLVVPYPDRTPCLPAIGSPTGRNDHGPRTTAAHPRSKRRRAQCHKLNRPVWTSPMKGPTEGRIAC